MSWNIALTIHGQSSQIHRRGSLLTASVSNPLIFCICILHYYIRILELALHVHLSLVSTYNFNFYDNSISPPAIISNWHSILAFPEILLYVALSISPTQSSPKWLQKAK